MNPNMKSTNSTGRTSPLTPRTSTSDISRSNWSVTVAAPPELTEVICVRPGIWPNWRSSGAVTAEVITSGLAPG